MANVYDIVPTETVNAFARNIFREQEENVHTLSSVLPTLNIQDLQYHMARGSLQDLDAAMARAFGTPAPIAKRQGLSTISGEIAPFALKLILGEEERLRKRQLERNITGYGAEMIAAIYDDVARLTRAMGTRFEMLRAEALLTGKLAINENGVELAADFGRNPLHNTAPITLWSNVAASTPLEDELLWLKQYKKTNGSMPVAMVTSPDVITAMQRNAQYRSYAMFNGITPAFLSVEQLNQVRVSYRLPPVVEYNCQARINGILTPIMDVKKLVYIPGPGQLGATFMGVTAEALVLGNARQLSVDSLSGVTVTLMVEDEPVSTATKVSAIGLPVLANPDLTFVATVLP